MEIDIIQKKENKVLNRTEVKFDCIYTGKTTPKILDVKNKLVALLNTKKELLVIDSLQPNYGEAKATGYAKFYDSKENLESIEPKHIIEKNKEPEANSKEESAPDDEETASDEDKTTSDEDKTTSDEE